MSEFKRFHLGTHGMESQDRPNKKQDIENRREKEQPWPLINSAESHFIENTGGEYQGFVEKTPGKKEFEDVRINRSAYYDAHRREVVETFVATEAVNDEGGDELRGPSEVEGFSMLIVRKSRAGNELENPAIISLRPKDFPARRINSHELRLLAHDLHDFVVQNAPHTALGELYRALEGRLGDKGWRNKE